MKFHAPLRISANRRKTPEGYWVIEGTPFARTGIQEYGADELPHLKAEADGVIRVYRLPEDVFDSTSLASWNGKSLTDDHPPDLVDPTTWRHLTKGIVLNPRRGTGDEAHLALCDLLVTDAGAQMLIDAGKVELSGGYNPEYVEFEPGKYKQTNIIGNHVALVTEGRCGPECAVRDGACGTHGNRKEHKMATETVRDRIKKFLGVTTDAQLAAALDAEPESAASESATHVHIHAGETMGGGGGSGASDADDPYQALSQRVGAMEDMMKDVSGWVKEQRDAKAAKDAEEAEAAKKAKEMEGKDADPESEMMRMTEEGGDATMKDSATLATAWQGTLSLAEIIAPGIPNLAALDAKTPRKSTLDALCAYRKKALELISMTPQGRLLVEEINGGKTFDAAGCKSCAKVRSMFLAVGSAMKRLNNSAAGGAGRSSTATADESRPISTVSDLSRRAEALFPTRDRQAAAR